MWCFKLKTIVLLVHMYTCAATEREALLEAELIQMGQQLQKLQKLQNEIDNRVERKCEDTRVLQCDPACKRDYNISTPIQKYWQRHGSRDDSDPTIVNIVNSDSDSDSKQKQKQKQNQTSELELELESEATIHFPFRVPFIRVRLQSLFSSQIIQQMNSYLYKLVLVQYSNIVNSNPGFTKLPPKIQNDQFFKWQTFQNRRRRSPCHGCEAGWAYLAEDRIFARLDAIIQNVTDSFLTYLNLDDLVKTRNRTLQEAWATVHHDGIGHRTHTHPDRMLSGVYYIKVPKDAGKIVFQDPRGGGHMPPFEGHIEIKPREGDLLIFPPWLAHGVRLILASLYLHSSCQVEETKGKDKRVSIAFNLPGQWKDLVKSYDIVKVPVGKNS